MCDITHITDRNTSLAQKILSLSVTETTLEEILVKAVLLIQREVQFEAVGIRLLDGVDYPYYFTIGFGTDFVHKEMFLCAKDDVGEIIRDSEGNPILECMCGNVIYGRTDPDLPFFTKNGSFWSNCTSDLLASTTEEDRMARTRNRCNGEGYESVALIPVRTEGTIHGLIQLNDKRKNMFTLDEIILYESIAASLGVVFVAYKTKLELAARADDVIRRAQVQLKILEKLSLKLAEYETGQDISDTRRKLDGIISEINSLDGIIPICASCKKVRTEPLKWKQIEQYISEHTCSHFTHTYCPDCYQKWISE